MIIALKFALINIKLATIISVLELKQIYNEQLVITGNKLGENNGQV